MIKIRRNVFETNSSSTHSITLCIEADFENWKQGKLYLNEYWSDSDNTSEFCKKTFVTKEQAMDILSHSKYYAKNDIRDDMDDEDIEEVLRDNDFYSYEAYYDTDLEAFSDEFTTPSGDCVVAFGKYGYDG